MSKNIILSSEGIFPLINDINGNPVDKLPATGLNLAGTIQGEGKLSGVPSIFIRLSGCNLRCIWKLPDGSFSRCDTPYASFHSRGEFKMEISDIILLVKNNLGKIKHVVVTGGEPLLQKLALRDLTLLLKTNLDVHVTLETNGTIFDPGVCANIDLFSVSPKLVNSLAGKGMLTNPGSAKSKLQFDSRVNIKALQKYINLCDDNGKDIQLKFVVGLPGDENEIKDIFLDRLHGWNNNQVLLMPLGSNPAELAKTTPLALEMAIRNGWRFTPRIHIDTFGAKAGV